MKRTFISLGVALLVTVLVDLSIILFDPTMYVEKAFNILVITFISVAIITLLALRSRARRRRAKT